MTWENQIEVRAAAIHAEIKAMAECARRSVGQRFRYLREETERGFNEIRRDLAAGMIRNRRHLRGNRWTAQQILNMHRSILLHALSINRIPTTKKGQQWHPSTK